MSRKNNRRGFTLIEMLVVIAIIAVLVAIIVPTVANATKKAQATTDAANLRAVLAVLNVDVLSEEKTVDEVIADSLHPTSKLDPDAILSVVYDRPGFIDVYYVNQSTSTYYGLDYLTEFAEEGASDVSTDEPTVPNTSTWYTVTGEITD